jgi:hypothetical protein
LKKNTARGAKSEEEFAGRRVQVPPEEAKVTVARTTSVTERSTAGEAKVAAGSTAGLTEPGAGTRATPREVTDAFF